MMNINDDEINRILVEHERNRDLHDRANIVHDRAYQRQISTLFGTKIKFVVTRQGVSLGEENKEIK